MIVNFRKGTTKDLNQLQCLALKSWWQFKSFLTVENWDQLYSSLIDQRTYLNLMETGTCFVCTSTGNEIIGMVFLISKNNPTEIYDKEWSYIRFLSVDPAFGGHGIDRKLTCICIDYAKERKEKYFAFHTSQLMGNARYIYESLGFKLVREIESQMGERYFLYKLSWLRINLNRQYFLQLFE